MLIEITNSLCMTFVLTPSDASRFCARDVNPNLNLRFAQTKQQISMQSSRKFGWNFNLSNSLQGFPGLRFHYIILFRFRNRKLLLHCKFNNNLSNAVKNDIINELQQKIWE